MEDDVDELPDLDFTNAAAIIFDKIYNGKDGVLPSSNFVDLIETLWEGFHSKDMAVHLQKVYPNGSDSLGPFSVCEVVCGQGGFI